jgi:hypothetical protein
MLTQYIMPSAVFAQNPAPAVKEMRAQSFTFVDASDHATATLSVEAGKRPGQLSLLLRDATGRVIWSAGGIGLIPLSAK